MSSRQQKTPTSHIGTKAHCLRGTTQVPRTLLCARHSISHLRMAAIPLTWDEPVWAYLFR